MIIQNSDSIKLRDELTNAWQSHGMPIDEQRLMLFDQLPTEWKREVLDQIRNELRLTVFRELR